MQDDRPIIRTANAQGNILQVGFSTTLLPPKLIFVFVTATQGGWKCIISNEEVSTTIACHYFTRPWKYGNLYCSQTVS